MFVPDRPFQPSLMLVGNIRNQPKGGAPERCFTRVSSSLIRKHYKQRRNFIFKFSYNIGPRLFRLDTLWLIFSVRQWQGENGLTTLTPGGSSTFPRRAETWRRLWWNCGRRRRKSPSGAAGQSRRCFKIRITLKSKIKAVEIGIFLSSWFLTIAIF